MKHISAAALAVASLVTLGFASSVHAENATVEATCDSITVTAPAYGRIIWSIDSEPPREVDDGGVATQAFFRGGVDANLQPYVMDSHHWSAVNVSTGETLYGDVDGCAPGEPQPTIVGHVTPTPGGYVQPIVERTVPEVVTMRLHGAW